MRNRIIFDLDGTLVDSRPVITRCIRDSLALLEQESKIGPSFEHLIGHPLAEVYGIILATEDGQLIRRALDIYRGLYACGGMFEAAVYPGIGKLLSDLQRSGCFLYVATMKSQPYAGLVLEHFGLAAYFAAIHGPDPAAGPYTRPELLAHLLKHENLPASNCVAVGDRADDVAAAHENGLPAVAVTYGYGVPAQIQLACADYVCDSAASLWAVLREIALG